MGNTNTGHERRRLPRHDMYLTNETEYQVTPVGNQERLRWLELRVRELEGYLHQDLEDGSDVIMATGGPSEWRQPALELWQAARKGNVQEVRALLGAGAETTFCDSGGVTALHSATQGAHAEVVRYLLAAGANPNAGNSAGFSPLHLAARFDLRGHCTSLLIAGGANLNSQSHQGITPLHVAALFSNKMAVRLLLSAGASKHIRDNLMGYTPKDLLRVK